MSLLSSIPRARVWKLLEAGVVWAKLVTVLPRSVVSHPTWGALTKKQLVKFPWSFMELPTVLNGVPAPEMAVVNWDITLVMVPDEPPE